MISSSIFIFVSIDSNAVSLTNAITNTLNDENMDDTDEYLNINEITIHEKINNKLNCNDRAKSIPK